MWRGSGLILLMAGLAVLIYGIQGAYHTHAAAFAAKPENQLMWFFIGGIAGIVIGSTMILLPSRKR